MPANFIGGVGPANIVPIFRSLADDFLKPTTLTRVSPPRKVSWCAALAQGERPQTIIAGERKGHGLVSYRERTNARLGQIGAVAQAVRSDGANRNAACDLGCDRGNPARVLWRLRS
jgi:hypothetical protein